MLNDYHDRLLELELAEHALLRAHGWRWATHNGAFFWLKPPGHRSSHTVYQTRSHAINSLKQWL